MTGWPDIVGTLPPTGRAFFLELKSPTGKATAEQAAFLYEMGQANALCLVARSLEDVVKALEEAGVYVPLQDRLL